MAFDFGSLEPRIYQILSAPGTDLSTISAKRVRRQLLELDPSLTADFLKENKKAVDKVIASVFERVSGDVNPEAGDAVEESSPGSQKPKQEENDETPPEDFTGEEGSPPPVKKSKKGTKQEQADAELARKLSSEINGRSTRTGGTKSRGSVAKRGLRAKKSSATVESDDDSDGEGGKKTRKRSSNGSGAKGGFAKEFTLR